MKKMKKKKNKYLKRIELINFKSLKIIILFLKNKKLK